MFRISTVRETLISEEFLSICPHYSTVILPNVNGNTRNLTKVHLHRPTIRPSENLARFFLGFSYNYNLIIFQEGGPVDPLPRCVRADITLFGAFLLFLEDFRRF